jgi:hypothetical protein
MMFTPFVVEISYREGAAVAAGAAGAVTLMSTFLFGIVFKIPLK